MFMLERVTTIAPQPLMNELVLLLQDAVASGASIGFLPPLTTDAALSYWQDIQDALQTQSRVLLIARDATGVVGAVQLDLPAKPNARHRAEVQKLLVHTRARRQGLARTLMNEIEAIAQRAGRFLLVLDTREGDVAVQLYQQRGYIAVGAIPSYAQNEHGTFDATIVFYRMLNIPPDQSDNAEPSAPA